MTKNDVIIVMRDFVVQKLFRGEAPSDFSNDTPLISSRLIDSIVVLSLVAHLESTLKVEFEAHEVNVDNLDTINKTADFLFQKSAK